MTSLPPIGTFCWAELATSDAAAGMSFYSQLFGWDHAARDMGEMGVYHMLSLGGGDLCGLYEMRGPMFEGVPPHWMYYVRVESVDATAARVAELGGSITVPPMDIPGVGRMFMFQDPTGARLSAFEYGATAGTPAEPNAVHAWCWAELHTKDTAAAKAFYTRLFGWQAKDSPGYTEWAVPGGKQFAGMIEMDDRWGDAPPNWMGYVRAEDCAAAVARGQELGAQVYVPPTQIDEVGTFAVLADPQGAVFAVIKLDWMG